MIVLIDLSSPSVLVDSNFWISHNFIGCKKTGIIQLTKYLKDQYSCKYCNLTVSIVAAL